MACTSCVNTCLCAVVAGDSSVTVAGSGSGADPYRITATPTASPIDCEEVQDCVGGMFDTVGFSYDDANGRFQPTSGTVGQALLITGPGTANWGTPAGGGGGGGVSSVSVTDTPSVNLTVTNPTGPSVDISAAVIAGCGLVSDATGVRVNTSATSLLSAGFGCADTNGAPIYCSADGTIRTLPPQTSQALLRLTAASPQFSIPTNQGLPVVASVSRVITNPSACRQASVHINSGQGWRTTTTGGATTGSVEGAGSQTFGGGALSAFGIAVWNPFFVAGNNAGNPATFATSAFRSSTHDSFVLGPSAVVTYTSNADLINRGTATITGFAGVEQAGILVTQ